jgi:hypothetical protein
LTSFYELRPQSTAGIFAVPYRGRRPRKALQLPDGAIVETPLRDQRCEAPDELVAVFEVGGGGVPATIHHANLGLVVAFLPLSGVYLLSNGDVAAIYGADVVPIDSPPVSAV